MKAFFYTFGCKVNQYETENIKEAMLSEGYEVTEDYADAEVCVVNTCTVTAQSDSKCRQLIHKIKKANPECLIVLAGCFPQAFPETAGTQGHGGFIGLETWNVIRLIHIIKTTVTHFGIIGHGIGNRYTCLNFHILSLFVTLTVTKLQKFFVLRVESGQNMK